MFGYVTLGTNDLDECVLFYDALLAEIGANRFGKTDSMAAWGTSPDSPSLMVTAPFDGRPASVGNGSMLALRVESSEKVDSLYRKAIDLGAADEGPPGPRGSSGFYAGYFRDPAGNKLNVFFPG